MIYLLLAVAILGHVIFWASIVNRLHGLGIERAAVDLATVVCGVAMAGLPLMVACLFWLHGMASFAPGPPLDRAMSAAWAYIYLAATWFGFSVLHRIAMAIHPERRGALATNHTTRLDLSHYRRAELVAPGVPRLLAAIPGNQILDLQIHEKRLVIPRLPAGRELRVAHITDLHMSGRVEKAYFAELVAAVNDRRPDLIMLTGDLVEREPCLAWLPETLGKLTAPSGVFFVLGNHDRHVDHRHLTRELGQLGLIHVGGRWCEVTARDVPLVIAGNELPWFGPAPRPDTLPQRSPGGLPLRILLAHTPDQFQWAAAHDFDLMLCGHNHGGQVCLPLLGPILAPSLHGVRYASGTFRRGETVMHVSRGTGGLTPFRWNCPPEIALLQLRSDAGQ